MIKPEQIPPEAWDKICEAFDVRPSEARAALAAAISAWPGMGTVATEDHAGTWRQIILPLTENQDDKA